MNSNTAPVSREWRKVNLSSRLSDRFKWSAKPFNPPGDFTDPVNVSNDFFDNDVIQMIATYSQLYARSKGNNTFSSELYARSKGNNTFSSELYARSKGNNTFSSTPAEMRPSLGVLLVSDYSPVPRRSLHWTLADDVHNEAIASAFTRSRFEEITTYMHLSDNARLNVGDKMSKVCPLLSIKNERFLRYFAFMKQ